MKKAFIPVLALAAIFVTGTAFASSCCPSEKGKLPEKQEMAAAMDHDDHAGHDHGKGHDGMSAHGDMIMVGTVEVDGVKAMVHLKDVREAMGKLGLKTTHHIMVMFSDAATGAAIDNGKAAVILTSPSGTAGDQVPLMGMQGHFGVDITLDAKGEYGIKIGSRIGDGEKRVFPFTHTVK